MPAGQQPVTLSERPFRLIAERGSDLVLICDLNMSVTYAGPSLYATFGFRARDVIGTAGWQYVHPLDVAQLRQEWQAAVSAPGEQREFELRMRNAAGQWRWVQLRISNLIADLAVAAMVLNLRDVTETRSMMDRLESSDRLLAEILDAALEGVWVIDASGRTVLANARMAELLAVDQVRLANGIGLRLRRSRGRGVPGPPAGPPGGRGARAVRVLLRPAGRHAALAAGVRGAALQQVRPLHRQHRDVLRHHRPQAAGVPELDRRSRPRPPEPGRIEPAGTAEAGIHRAAGSPVSASAARCRPSGTNRCPGLDRLSRREYEVVKLLLHGDRVPVIARQLFVSQSTVRNHLSSVFRKLRVRSQQELIVLLRERKLHRLSRPAALRSDLGLA